MKFKNYSVEISAGHEINGGYVEMVHGQKYKVVLTNYTNKRADAELNIDGKYIGTFRLEPYGTIQLERPLDDKGRFTFYKNGTKEYYSSELNNVSKDNLGLVSVTFKPEKVSFPIYTTHYPNLPWYYPPLFGERELIKFTCFTSGGTGLSGHSHQEFTNVNKLEYDEESVTINLRLVCSESDIRPLRGYHTPIPKPI